MIKAVVFDLDGMVFKEPHYYTEELEIKYGIPLKDSLFSNDPNYLDCKKGKIKLDQFLGPYYKRWRKYPKYRLTLEETKREWFEFAKINKEVFDIARRLKEKGILNLIMTNNTRERVEFLDRKYHFSKIFEIIGSYNLGVLKPDLNFYQILKDKYRLQFSEVLYFDDKKDTVEVLKKLGFKAEIYHSVEEFKKTLATFDLYLP
jgi:HAD superfamily hydrolase (TIGR01509 family)